MNLVVEALTPELHVINCMHGHADCLKSTYGMLTKSTTLSVVFQTTCLIGLSMSSLFCEL